MRPLHSGRIFRRPGWLLVFMIHSQQKGFSPFAPLGEFLF
jgi:hypothetical protein